MNSVAWTVGYSSVSNLRNRNSTIYYVSLNMLTFLETNCQSKWQQPCRKRVYRWNIKKNPHTSVTEDLLNSFHNGHVVPQIENGTKVVYTTIIQAYLETPQELKRHSGLKPDVVGHVSAVWYPRSLSVWQNSEMYHLHFLCFLITIPGRQYASIIKTESMWRQPILTASLATKL